MNGSSSVRGLPGAYPSVFCQKVSIRSKSLTSITMDPIRTVAFPMTLRTQESGYEFCDIAGRNGRPMAYFRCDPNHRRDAWGRAIRAFGFPARDRGGFSFGNS